MNRNTTEIAALVARKLTVDCGRVVKVTHAGDHIGFTDKATGDRYTMTVHRIGRACRPVLLIEQSAPPMPETEML